MKYKAEKGNWESMGCAILNRFVLKSFSVKMTFELRPNEDEEANHVDLG